MIELVAPDTVNTMPEATLDATGDHGQLSGDTITATTPSAGVFASLGAPGVDYDDVVQVLEDEGVSKFEASWVELLDTVDRAGSLTSKDPAHRTHERGSDHGQCQTPALEGPAPATQG